MGWLIYSVIMLAGVRRFMDKRFRLQMNISRIQRMNLSVWSLKSSRGTSHSRWRLGNSVQLLRPDVRLSLSLPNKHHYHYCMQQAYLRKLAFLTVSLMLCQGLDLSQVKPSSIILKSIKSPSPDQPSSEKIS